MNGGIAAFVLLLAGVAQANTFWKSPSYFLFTNRDNSWRWVVFAADGKATILRKAPWAGEGKQGAKP